MHTLESMFLATQRLQPDIDDVFGVWTHGKEALFEYFNFLNTAHPSIKFTVEHTADTGSLDFLDTKIVIADSGAYTIELYVKPMSSPVITNYPLPSAHPMYTKKNAV